MKRKIKLFIQKLIIKITNKNCKISSVLPKDIKIGKYVVIEKNIVINNTVKEVGDGTYICENTYIHNCSSVGKYCSIARDVSIGVGNHPKDWVLTTPLFYSKSRGLVKEDKYDDILENRSTIIGNDVWIGTKVTILSGIEIGDGAIIAAGSVVTKDVKPYTIVGGVPAKEIKNRFEENIKSCLEKNNIFELSIEEIKLYSDDIDKPMIFIRNIKDGFK